MFDTVIAGPCGLDPDDPLLPHAALVARVTGARHVCLVTDWIGAPPAGLAGRFGEAQVEIHGSLETNENTLLERAGRSPGAVLVVPRQAADGTTAAAVAARAPVPVWMVPPGQAAHLATLLVATDLSRDSEEAYRTGAELAARACARVRVLHVYWRGPGARECAVCADEARDREAAEVAAYVAAHPMPGLAPIPEVREDMHVAAGLQAAAEAEQADLVVMGRRGWNRARAALLGSAVVDMFRVSTCPVLVVPETRTGGGSP